MVHDEVKEVPNPKVDSSKPGEDKSKTNNGDNDSKGFKTTPPNQRTGVCPGYRHGNCPHGLNGRKRIDGAKCSKAHPSYCYKWRKAGSDPIRGCTEGRNCRYFHPIVCKLSAKGQRCEKEECSYLHLQRAPKKRKSTVSHRTGPSPAPPAKSARDRTKKDTKVTMMQEKDFYRALQSQQEELQKGLKDLRELVATFQPPLPLPCSQWPNLMQMAVPQAPPLMSSQAQFFPQMGKTFVQSTC